MSTAQLRMLFFPVLIEMQICAHHLALNELKSRLCHLGYFLNFSAECQMNLEPERHKMNGMHSCIKKEVEIKNDYSIVSLLI